jgi:16S rRNA processing protein RimM
MGERSPRSPEPVPAHGEQAAVPRSGSDALVPLGVVIGAHGLRGELRVKLYNPGSDLLAGVRQVALRREVETQTTDRVALRNARAHGGGVWLVTLDGCTDRDTATALRGTDLCIARAELPALPPGEHYLVDLVGLDARLPDGSAVGVVEAAVEYPASQVLRVRVQGGAVEVPMFAPYLVEVRLDEGAVIVDHVQDLELLRAKPPHRP